MTTQELIEWLSRLYYLNKDIEHIEGQIRELTVLSGSGITTMPGGNNTDSKVEKFVFRYEVLLAQLRKKQKIYIKERTEIEEFIDGISDIEVRVIARMRFVDHLKYETIGERLCMDRTTAQKRLMRFLESYAKR